MKLPIKIFKQKTDHTCGPATLKMFLYFHGLDRGQSEEQLAVLLRTCPLVGTKFEVISAYLWKQEIDIITERSDSNIDVKTIIDAGKVILTEWIDWGGHFIIINGYDDTHYYLADPEEGHGKVKQDKFHSMWFTKGESFSNLLYLT